MSYSCAATTKWPVSLKIIPTKCANLVAQIQRLIPKYIAMDPESKSIASLKRSRVYFILFISNIELIYSQLGFDNSQLEVQKTFNLFCFSKAYSATVMFTLMMN